MSKLRNFLIFTCLGLFCGALLQFDDFKKLAQKPLAATNALALVVVPLPENSELKGVSPEAIDLYKQEIEGKFPSVVDYYEDKLAKQEQALWDEIYTDTGFSYQEAVEVKEDIVRDKALRLKRKKSRRPKYARLSQEVIQLAYQVLDDFQVPQSAMEIVPSDCASYDTCKLMISEDQLRCMPKEGARSVLAHELMHHRFGDPAMRCAMDGLLYKKNLNHTKFAADHIYYKHMRFEELRADILSALKDISYAQGAIEGLSSLMAECGDCGYPSHPLTSERIETIQQIIDLLLYEQALN